MTRQQVTLLRGGFDAASSDISRPGVTVETPSNLVIPTWTGADLALPDWAELSINDDPVSPGPNSPAVMPRSVVNGRLRFANPSATGLTTNDRRCLVHRGTSSWRDAEIRAAVWGGIYEGLTRFQLGVVGRVAFIRGRWRAVAVWHDIAFGVPSVWNAAQWNFETTTPDPADASPDFYFESYLGGGFTNQFLNVVSETVTDGSRASSVSSLTLPAHHDIPVGGHITADVADNTYDGTFPVTARGNTSVSYAQALANDPSAGAGTVTSLWPVWLAVRVVRNTVTLKVWRYMQPEPDWADSEHARSHDITLTDGSVPIDPLADQPGMWGIVVNHQGTNPASYGEIQMRQLAAAA